VFDRAGLRGELAAPTGNAAKRITKATGRKAQTLHSLVGYSGAEFTAFNQACPLPAQYLVLDEFSMADTMLAAKVLDAAANNCRIIILGDVDQLASVGPGQVLRDLIRSGFIAVVRLLKVFRQGHGSGIIDAVNEINSGKVPESSADGQYVFVETDEPAVELIKAFEALVKSGVDPDEIQALSPTHRGEAGCQALNRALQSYLNPEPKGGTTQRLRRDAGDIRVTDRVIQKKNDKDLGLVNGDIGWIDEISSDKGNVLLSLPDKDKPVHMDSTQTLSLLLAYVITIHSSQGAEAPYILLALDRSAAFMLRRNLAYTGASRGSKKVMVFSSRSTMTAAVRRGEPPEGSRRTSLVAKLKVAFASKTPTLVGVPVKDPLAAAMLSDLDADVPF
jgi:exodeoxyribonuclease V alpha subunit